MASRADISYNDSLLTGLIPRLCKSCFTAFGFLPVSFAISLIVVYSLPSTIIVIFSVILTVILTGKLYLLYSCIGKFIKNENIFTF